MNGSLWHLRGGSESWQTDWVRAWKRESLQEDEQNKQSIIGDASNDCPANDSSVEKQFSRYEK